MEGKDGGEGWGEGSGVLSRPAEVKQALFAEPPSPALPLGQSAQTLQLATAGLPQKPSCHFQRGWGGCHQLPRAAYVPPHLSTWIVMWDQSSFIFLGWGCRQRAVCTLQAPQNLWPGCVGLAVEWGEQRSLCTAPRLGVLSVGEGVARGFRPGRGLGGVPLRVEESRISPSLLHPFTVSGYSVLEVASQKGAFEEAQAELGAGTPARLCLETNLLAVKSKRLESGDTLLYFVKMPAVNVWPVGGSASFPCFPK